MTPLPHRLDVALKRIAKALDHLDAAVERRVIQDQQSGDQSQEFAVMQDDRARLAVELDGTLAKSKRIEAAAKEAGKRLERASATLKALLSAHDAS